MEVEEEEQGVEGTWAPAPRTWTAPPPTPPAPSLVTASVSATPPAWGSAGARGPPSVGAEVEEGVEEGVEEEELLEEAEVVELLQEVEGVEV